MTTTVVTIRLKAKKQTALKIIKGALTHCYAMFFRTNSNFPINIIIIFGVYFHQKGVTLIYHLHTKNISRSAGRSSVGASAYTSGSILRFVAYRSGEKIFDNAQDVEHNFSHKRGVVYSDILLPEKAPAIFKDRQTLWNTVEESEKRCDARLAREIEVSLSREFGITEDIEVLEEYIVKNFVCKGMIADFSIHDKGDGNPHAHILLTTRDVDESGFKNKNRSWNEKSRLFQWRESWADICNKKFEAKGLAKRIDHRTLEAQGIDRLPTEHLGHEAHALERKGIRTVKGDINREIIKRNLIKMKLDYIELSKEISAEMVKAPDTNQEIKAIKDKINNIESCKSYLEQVNEKMLNAKNKYNNLGLLDVKQKKTYHEYLTSLEEVRARVKADFKGYYGVEFGKADDLTSYFKYQIATKYTESQKSKLPGLQQKRNRTEYEYKKILTGARRYHFFNNSDFNDLRLDMPTDIRERVLIVDVEKRLNNIDFEARNRTGIDTSPSRENVTGYDMDI